MRRIASALCVVAALVSGCAGFQIDTGHLVEAARRSCAVVDVLADDPDLIDPEDLEEALRACHIARALAGLPPITDRPEVPE